MPYINFDRNKVFYEEKGQGSPLLLLHGNCVSSKMFVSEIEYFSQFYRVIYFDYPGVGRSSRMDKLRDDFWNYNAKCALFLMEFLNIPKFYMVGTSGGAVVGTNLGIMAADKVIAFVGDSFFGEYVLKSEADNIKKNRSAAKSEILASAFWKNMHGADWSNIVDLDIDLMLRTAYNEVNPIVGDPDEFRAPVLFTGSMEDELIGDMDKRLYELSLKMPNCSVQIYEKGKHPLMITRKPLFREIVLNYFRNIPNIANDLKFNI
jgi:pimeloyl-ACP methyl ester carboxylesterase